MSVGVVNALEPLEHSAVISGGVVHRWSNTENRRITEACFLHFEAIGSLPSIRELTEVAFVSERRLRQAFEETFGVAPSRYFRRLALDGARERLSDPEVGLNVYDVALEAGFRHSGRFARYYRAAFGELPSETLAEALQ